jgi:hypothetical protein
MRRRRPRGNAVRTTTVPTFASNFRDGSSSSFGAPNLWSGGTFTQDFSVLRSVVPEPGAAALVGVALAALLSARARRGV